MISTDYSRREASAVDPHSLTAAHNVKERSSSLSVQMSSPTEFTVGVLPVDEVPLFFSEIPRPISQGDSKDHPNNGSCELPPLCGKHEEEWVSNLEDAQAPNWGEEDRELQERFAEVNRYLNQFDDGYDRPRVRIVSCATNPSQCYTANLGDDEPVVRAQENSTVDYAGLEAGLYPFEAQSARGSWAGKVSRISCTAVVFIAAALLSITLIVLMGLSIWPWQGPANVDYGSPLETQRRLVSEPYLAMLKQLLCNIEREQANVR